MAEENNPSPWKRLDPIESTEWDLGETIWDYSPVLGDQTIWDCDNDGGPQNKWQKVINV